MSAFGRLFQPSRLTPEVLEALRVILGALFEEPIDLTARAKQWAKEGGEHIRRKAERERHEAEQKKRIKRAERGVKTRREKSKKKVGVAKKARPAKRRTKERNCRSTSLGYRCIKHGSHAGDHRDSTGHIWPPSPRVSKKPADPKPKHRALRIPGGRCQARHKGDQCTLDARHKVPHNGRNVGSWIIIKKAKRK